MDIRQLPAAIRVRGLKGVLGERFPRLAYRYKRLLRPLVGSRSRFAKLDAWASAGPTLQGESGFEAIKVDAGGVWLLTGDGLQYRYMAGPQTMLGLKTGEPFEPAEISLLKTGLPDDGVLVDIGANIGRLTMEVAITMPRLQVLAVEPVKDTYDALEANIRRNGLESRVATCRLALGAHAGSGVMTADRGSANHLVDGTPSAGQEEIEISTLDQLISQHPLDRVDVIKCDVEGAELLVLEGATDILERLRPALLLEIEERWISRYGRSATELFDFLLSRGYAYRRISMGRVEPAGSSVADDLLIANNFWFTPAEGTSTPQA
jgi:FkbM family methyltransferase